jgi:hypothetical protein
MKNHCKICQQILTQMRSETRRQVSLSLRSLVSKEVAKAILLNVNKLIVDQLHNLIRLQVKNIE